MDYFKSHWNGELSLPIAFWVNIVLLNVAVSLVSPALRQLAIDHPGRWLTASVLLFHLSLILVLYPWQVVGVWRSATNWSKRRGKSTWSSVAKFLVVIGLITTIGNVVAAAPGYWEALLYVGQFDTKFHSKLTVSDDRRSLRIEGQLGYGLVGRVNTALSQNPTIDRLILDSAGGRLIVARELGEIIKHKGLNTYSLVGCYSACTLAFVSGKKRFLAKGATLAFHQYRGVLVDQMSSLDIAKEQEKDLALFAKQGVTADFRAKLFQTENTDLWYPAIDELLNSHVVSRVVNASEFHREDWGLSELQKDEFDRLFSSLPGFSAIKNYDAKLFGEIANELRARFERGANQAEITGVVGERLQKAFYDSLSKSSDAATIKFVSVLVKMIEPTIESNPIACLRYLYPNKYGSNAGSEIFTKEQKAELLEAMGQVIIDRYTKRPTPVSEQLASESLPIVTNGLLADLEFADRGQFANSADYARACRAVVSMYENVLRKDPHPANTIRFLLAP